MVMVTKVKNVKIPVFSLVSEKVVHWTESEVKVTGVKVTMVKGRRSKVVGGVTRGHFI